MYYLYRGIYCKTTVQYVGVAACYNEVLTLFNINYKLASYSLLQVFMSVLI